MGTSPFCLPTITTIRFTKPNQYAKNPYLQCDKSINTMEELELTHLNDDGTEKFMSDKVILQQLEPFLQDQLYKDYQSSVRG